MMANGDTGGSVLFRLVGTTLVLFVLWQLMSGLYKPLVVGLGIASVLLVVFIIRRMDGVDEDRVDINLNPLKFIGYFGWLLVEIAKANWAVTKIVMQREMPMRQHLFRAPYTQRTDLGQVIFANSITLTPGTISVEVEDGQFLVHAVDYSDDDMDALADMDARVTATEGRA